MTKKIPWRYRSLFGVYPETEDVIGTCARAAHAKHNGGHLWPP